MNRKASLTAWSPGWSPAWLACLAIVAGASIARAQGDAPANVPSDLPSEVAAEVARDLPPPHEERFVLVTARVRPSIVAIGSYSRTDTPTVIYFGTGFVVGDGLTVVTNQHVVEALRQNNRLEHLRVFFPDDHEVRGRSAQILGEDSTHDLAVLSFEGPKAPTLELLPLSKDHAPQGRSVGIMGYPIGLQLGLVPAVHKGVIAAVVPAVLPLPKGAKMTDELAEAIRNPYRLYQLDIVAFPGNSGSPLFDGRTGQVIGVVNKVLGTRTREHLITNPSGITYAVPVRWVHELVIRATTSTDSKTKDSP